MIHQLNEQDWPEIKRIYIQGIETNMATFMSVEEVTTYTEWIKKKIPTSCLGYLKGDQLMGWSALSPVSSRPVYSGVAEVSVYIDLSQSRKGIGSQLMKAMIDFAENNQIWTLQSAIFPENKASTKLHEKYGFRLVGYREKIGQLNGIWKDNLFFERRSKIIL